MSSFYTTSAAAPDGHWFTGTLATVHATNRGTGGVLAMVEFAHPDGYATPLHVHHTADEAFYVLSGSLTGICGDTRFRAETGGFVWLPREVRHGYLAEPGATLRTLAIATPAGFDEFVTELSEPARGHRIPETPFFPDPDTFVAVGTKHGIETLAPPDVLVGMLTE